MDQYGQQGHYGEQQAQPPSQQPQGPYPPQGYPPQPPRGFPSQPPYPPQPPRKSWPSRHKFATGCLGSVAGVIVLIIIIAVAVSAGGGSPSGSSSSGGQAAAPAGGPHIGQPAADGKFRFVITRVSHTKSVGDTSMGLGETAQGRFSVLHIRVTNISNQSQTLDDSSQYVYDASGRKFDADTQADIDANPGNGGGVFLNDINPGNSVNGVILFDLPHGDKAVKAELHDSAFSGGVTVSLTH
jgi:Domain of unknown function (DUF4352)